MKQLPGQTRIRYVGLACYVAEEFRKTHLTRRWDLSYDERLKPARIPIDTPANSFDWRDHGAVTPVKNQVWVELNVLVWTVVRFYAVLLCSQHILPHKCFD